MQEGRYPTSWRGRGRPARGPHALRLLRKGSLFEFIGNHPVLDFNNTAAWPRGRPSSNRIATGPALVQWATEAGVISSRERFGMRKIWKGPQLRIRKDVEQAQRLREMLHKLLIARVGGSPPPAEALTFLESHLRKARNSMTLVWEEAGLKWIPRPARSITAVVDRIAWHAAELLSSSELKRLKCCANPECGWMFLDYGNGTRRWCSMRECGDRAKSKRYYEKKSKNTERNLRPKNIS